MPNHSTFTKKLAELAMRLPAFRRSWQAHMEVFLPILEPAFKDDPVSRVHLCAALNHLARKNAAKAHLKLYPLHAACKTDADRTAWHFFMGLHAEAANDVKAMMHHFEAANALGHRFYMPYVKVAEFAFWHGELEIAEANYQAAIDCYYDISLDDQVRAALCFAYSRLASAQTIMHRYEDAAATLSAARRILPDHPPCYAAQAILQAATGRFAEAEASLASLKERDVRLAESAQGLVAEIRDGSNAVFCTLPMSDSAVASFWAWFTEAESHLRTLLELKRNSEAVRRVLEQLEPLMPVHGVILDVKMNRIAGKFSITLRDHYALTVSAAFDALCTAMPETLRDYWQIIRKP